MTQELDNPFVYEEGFTDVFIKVGDMKIHANKGVLMYFSRFFKDMFLLCKTDEEEIVIDEDPESFLEFFRCIYPTTLEPVTDDNFNDILRLQDKYGIGNSVVSRCDYFLEEYIRERFMLMRDVDLISKLEIADKYNLEKTITTGVKAMETIDCFNVHKSTMSDKLKVTILTDRLLRLEKLVDSKRSCYHCTGQNCSCGQIWTDFEKQMKQSRQRQGICFQ